MKSTLIMSLVVVSMALLLSGGCTQPNATISHKISPYRDQNINLVEPKFIVVRKFAVTPQDIRILAPGLTRNGARDHQLTAEERSVGDALSAAIQRETVQRLNAAHIEAYPEGAKDERSYKTGVLQGYFFQADDDKPGSKELGFELDDDTYCVRVLTNIKEVQVAELTIDVTSDLKPNLDQHELEKRISIEAALIADKIVNETLIPAYRYRGWLK